MKLHREGLTIVFTSTLTASILIGTILFFGMNSWPNWLLLALSLIVFGMLFLIVQFFRMPHRVKIYAPDDIVCPADGKVVVIEEVFEPEYLKENCIQISIFMSPLNVHANHIPISGKVIYTKYHPGSFLVAWHPKSSTENERSTLVIENKQAKKVLVRQIAGAVARRICFYAKENDMYNQGDEFGFIKFGSRVDVFLPLGTQIDVKIGDVVKNRITVIGKI